MAANWLAPTWLQRPQLVLDRLSLVPQMHTEEFYGAYQLSSDDQEYVCS